MDKKFTPGEILIVASGAILLVISFFNWYGIDFGGLLSVGYNGWQAPSAFLSVVAILLGVAMAAFVVVTKLGVLKVPDKAGNLGWGVILLGAGGVAAVFLILKWLFNTDFTKLPLFIAILAGIGLAVGGLLTAKERGDIGAAKGPGAGSPPAA